MKSRFSAITGLALATALTLGACASSEPGEPTPVAGGDLIVAANGLVSQLDVARMNSSSVFDYPALAAVYGLLAYRSTDGEVVPHLAESIESNDEGDVWTLTLREGLKFSDGTDFDADAVVANYDRFRDPDVGSSKAANLAGITYTAVDEVTVRFELPAPNPMFAHDFASYLAFHGSPTAFQADPEGFVTKPIGAGPFVIDEWVQGASMTLSPNPYYPEDMAPLLDSLTFEVYVDTQQGLNTVTAGSADMNWTNLPNILRDAEAAGLQMETTLLGGGGVVYPHATQGPFADIRAREVLLYAIDRQKALDSAYGAGTAATAFFEPGSPWHDPNGLFPESDPERAQELLDELAAEGTPLSFTFTVNEAHRPIVEAVQTQLLAYDNIEVSVEVLDNAAYTARLRAGDFEAAYNAATWDAPYPNLQDYFGTGNARNYYKVSDAEVDRLLKQARDAATVEEQAEAYAKVQSIVLENVWMVNLDHWTIGYVFNSDVAGVQLIGNGSAMLWEKVGFLG